MRAELTLGLTGMSILAHDPLAVGFAPETHLHLALSFFGIMGLALLTLWSERWLDTRPAPECKDSTATETDDYERPLGAPFPESRAA
jgi:hypothetical protein